MCKLKRNIFLFLMIFSSSLYSFSQKNIEKDGLIISGKVFDRESKQAVPFASVILGDTRRGTVCDSLGFFKMTVYVKANLKISALGFHDKIAKIKIASNDSEIFLNIGMDRSSLMLDQVDVYDPGNLKM